LYDDDDDDSTHTEHDANPLSPDTRGLRR